MPLRPDDVVKKSFSTSRLRQGYDVNEVDAFLDEVVEELRRLYAHVDELGARAFHATLTDADDEQESQRLKLERQQLDVIRAERAELVDELQALQSQIDTTREASVDAISAEVGDGIRDRSAELQQQVDDLQLELERLQQRHQRFRDRMIISAREHLQLLESGRAELLLQESADRPPVS